MDESLWDLTACLLCDAQLYSGLALICCSYGFSRMQSFEAGAVLFRAGSARKHLFVLRQGQIKLMMISTDGREQIIGLAVPGQLLGVTTLEDPVYPCTAKALTQSLVCRIAYQELVNIVETNPRVSLHLVRLLNQERRFHFRRSSSSVIASNPPARYSILARTRFRVTNYSGFRRSVDLAYGTSKAT